MKFVIALLALIASACSSPPDEVDVVASKVVASSPFGFDVAQQVYVGQDATLGHSTLGATGVLFISYGPGHPCAWVTISNASGYVAVNTDIYGSFASDFMAHVRTNSTMYCPNGVYYELHPPVVANPNIQMNLYGLTGDDAIICAGSSIAGWSRNSCYGNDGNDVMATYDNNNTVHGDTGNDSILVVQGNDWAAVYGDAGSDCINRGIAHNGVIDCGTGADRIPYTNLGSIACETIATDTCGF